MVLAARHGEDWSEAMDKYVKLVFREEPLKLTKTEAQLQQSYFPSSL